MANLITICRIVISILLLFISTLSSWFYVLYGLCGLTDMVDGYVARKTNTVSEMGAKLDSIADVLFVVVCLIKIISAVNIPRWLWVWIVVIAVIKIVNIISGYTYQHQLVMLHTIANKVTGFLLFLLPLSFCFVDIKYAAIPVCIAATFAAVQEGHFIRTGRKIDI